MLNVKATLMGRQKEYKTIITIDDGIGGMYRPGGWDAHYKLWETYNNQGFTSLIESSIDVNEPEMVKSLNLGVSIHDGKIDVTDYVAQETGYHWITNVSATMENRANFRTLPATVGQWSKTPIKTES